MINTCRPRGAPVICSSRGRAHIILVTLEQVNEVNSRCSPERHLSRSNQDTLDIDNQSEVNVMLTLPLILRLKVWAEIRDKCKHAGSRDRQLPLIKNTARKIIRCALRVPLDVQRVPYVDIFEFLHSVNRSDPKTPYYWEASFYGILESTDF